MAVITKVMKKNLSAPDETRTFGQSKMELVDLEGMAIARMTLAPGWSWEKDVKPLVNTQTCLLSHTQYCIQGRLMVTMDDGTELAIGPGDAVVVPPGHKAKVVGDEPFVAIDFEAGRQYAVQQEEPAEIDWDEMMEIE